MTDTMMPVIRQMLDADGDAARAKVLLSAPVGILLRYRPSFEAACGRARFDAGLAYLALVRVAQDAVRRDGLPAEPLGVALERARLALVAIARGRDGDAGTAP